MFNRNPSPSAQEPETTNANVGNDASRRDGQAEENLAGLASDAGTTDAAEQYRLLQDQFTRLAADFENYRKRMREEHESLLKYGSRKSITELLPVLDNLERASAGLREDSDPKVLYKSFQVIQKQLMDGLDALGMKKIQAVGHPFDPQFHEAVSQMPSAEHPENIILYETQSGYQLYDKVLRPAMVVVSTGAATEAVAEPQSAAVSAAVGADEAASHTAKPAESRKNPFLQNDRDPV